jgi:hypothetical protein
MEQSKRKEDSTNEAEQDGSTQKPDADATSKETLGDVQESEKDSGSTADKVESGPSPDGAFDESDEIKDAGPM